MFNKEKPTTEKFLSNSATLISAGTKLKGDVRSENDLRIDGTIKGNVSSSAKIIVGPTGFVEGNIDGAQADITGKVQGNIMAKEMVQLRDQSNVQGNITTASLQIDIGAVFNGQSIMGVAADNVVQMTEGEGIHAKAN
jgi:cytoskeletal protein CcmA (bactofilin family)